MASGLEILDLQTSSLMFDIKEVNEKREQKFTKEFKVPANVMHNKTYFGFVDLDKIDNRDVFDDKYRLFYYQVLEYMRKDCKVIGK
jgi:hypothetical protein